MAPASRAQKLTKIAGGIAAVAGLFVLGFVGFNLLAPLPSYPVPKLETKVMSTPERLERGKKLAGMLCLECHVDPVTKKASGKKLPDLPPELGEAYSVNLTHDPETGVLSKYTDGELTVLLRTGLTRDGRFLPPWMPRVSKMADEDIASVIAFMRSEDPVLAPEHKVTPQGKLAFLGRFLMRVAWKPPPMPAQPIAIPAATDKVEYGRYIAQGVGACFACHSKDFSVVNELSPEASGGHLGGGTKMIDASGETVFSTNITPDNDTGIGTWSEAEFSWAMREGKRPNGTLVRYPMGLFTGLSDNEVSALYAYLRTVPPLKHAVVNSSAAIVSSSPGQIAYHKYGCVGCHGPSGVAIGDLRTANKSFPADAELEAYLRNPQKARPGVRMPAFEGVIADADYPALIGYVRTLSSK